MAGFDHTQVESERDFIGEPIFVLEHCIHAEVVKNR